MLPEWLTPQALNDISVVGLVVFSGFGLFLALGRRWLIPRGQHREIVDLHIMTKHDLVAQIKTQASTIDVLTDTNRAQARALERFSATGELSGKILASIHEIAEAGGQ